MKSPEHKQRVEELRQEGEPVVLEELITVDAVGCFEGEEEADVEEDAGVLHQGEQASQREVALDDLGEDEVYDSDTQYGSSFVVPVAGYLCRLCHKFYHFESTARLSHCKSLGHFQKLQKHKALRNPRNASVEDGKENSELSKSPNGKTQENLSDIGDVREAEIREVQVGQDLSTLEIQMDVFPSQEKIPPSTTSNGHNISDSPRSCKRATQTSYINKQTSESLLTGSGLEDLGPESSCLGLQQSSREDEDLTGAKKSTEDTFPLSAAQQGLNTSPPARDLSGNKLENGHPQHGGPTHHALRNKEDLVNRPPEEPPESLVAIKRRVAGAHKRTAVQRKSPQIRKKS